MSTSTAAVTSSSTGYNNAAFWERLWRMSGINFVAFALIAYFVYGMQPQVGASADALTAFYEGHRTRILIAAVISGMAVLNLLWFVAALRTTLADSGQGGWGAAATTAGSMVGTLCLLLITLVASLAYAGVGIGNPGAVNDLAWAGTVLSSFPRAMLIMAGSFGLWRSGRISNAAFGAGVTVVVLVLLGGTTWMSEGFWAPDGAYSRIVSPILGLAWVLAVSQVLLARTPATRAGW